MTSSQLVPDPRSEPTITVPRAAEILGVGKHTAYAAVACGEIPSLRVGRHLRVPTARLLDMLGLPPGQDKAA